MRKLLNLPNYHLIMKNKLYYLFAFIIILFTNTISLAQVTTSAQSTYIPLNSYTGSTTNDAYGFRVHINGTNVNVQNWSLIARVNNPIMNSEGKTIDPSKISIRINSISGDGFTLQSIGTNNTPIPLSLVEVPIFRNSQAPIKSSSSGYTQIYFSFDIIIAGGSYLEVLKSWQNYNLNIILSIKDSQNQLISQSTSPLQIQIQPNDSPPNEPSYGIQVNSNARDGLLEFRSISDYVNGVSVTYKDGLSISSNTPYAVQVRTLTSNFESGNNVLPVNIVSLNIKASDNSTSGNIVLSESTQTVLKGLNNSNQNHLFDISYYTKPNDERLLKVNPDNFRTTLVYTLIPQ